VPITLSPVDAAALYTLREAADLIPGRHGKSIHPMTLQGWLQTGKAKGQKHGNAWYILGSEVQRLRDGEQPEQEPAAR